MVTAGRSHAVREQRREGLTVGPYRRDGMAFHFTWVPDAPAVRPVLTMIEEALAPYSVRPHWGKLHETAPADRYEHWSRFAGLLSDLDPFGKFRNEVVDHYFPR